MSWIISNISKTSTSLNYHSGKKKPSHCRFVWNENDFIRILKLNPIKRIKFFRENERIENAFIDSRFDDLSNLQSRQFFITNYWVLTINAHQSTNFQYFSVLLWSQIGLKIWHQAIFHTTLNTPNWIWLNVEFWCDILELTVI